MYRKDVHAGIRKADRKAEQLRKKAKERYDRGARKLSTLAVGDVVRVQHHATKRWRLIGEIVEVNESGRSYLVKSETGRLYWRNRRFLRPLYDGSDLPSDTGRECLARNVPEQEAATESRNQSGGKAKDIPLRRSTRAKKQPKRYEQ